MKTAKEMFEELEFIVETEDDYELVYIKNEHSEYDKYGLEFDLTDKDYTYYNVSEGLRFYGEPTEEKLIQAIHQQMKELGWLNA